MTKKDYVAISAIVERNNLGNSHLVDDLIRMFEKDNPGFDRMKFVAACGRIVHDRATQDDLDLTQMAYK